MLKLTFILESNIRSKFSKSRLPSFYNRIYLILSLFSKHLNVRGCGFNEFKYRFVLRRNKVVVMRSPFHYKTSKTILTRPSTKLYFNVVIPNCTENMLFLNKGFLFFLKTFNNNTNLSCTKIICKEFLC